jgi:hypothetical protein
MYTLLATALLILSQVGSASAELSANDYADCVVNTATTFARSPDPADVVVEAAAIKCGPTLARYLNSAPKNSLAADKDAREMIRKTLEEIARDRALVRVLEIRSAR